MRSLALIFASAFATNFVWENLHAVFYAHYQGNPITEPLLVYASTVDALVITLLLLPFLYVRFFETRPWLIVLGGIIISVGIEWFALATGRWAYSPDMPIIPLLGTGLTPTVQLGLLGYMSFRICRALTQPRSPGY